MIPPLGEHGLLPAGVHATTLDEIKTAFGWNDHRAGLIAHFERFLAVEWSPLAIACPIWVDGSFVRAKALPSDIDIVIDLSAVTDLKALSLAIALRWRHDEIKLDYHVDVWPRHPALPLDLSAFFQYVGEKAAAELHLPIKHPKGILLLP